MKEQVICIVDCRTGDEQENNYFCINLWGKPVFFYVLEECLQSGCFSMVYIITNSEYIEAIAKRNFGDQIVIENDLPNKRKETIGSRRKRYFIVHGCAVMLKKETIKNILDSERKGKVYSIKRIKNYTLYPNILRFVTCEVKTNAFIVINAIALEDMKEKSYLLDLEESLVVQNQNDFELALILKKKEQNAVILLNAIRNRIQQKLEILQNRVFGSVCLLGHSQFDDWDVQELCGMPVRNCSIRGISSFQYREMILEQDLLDCGSNVFVVMQGTNDIVYNYAVEQIVRSIQKIIFYIKSHNQNALICVVPCLHVNGRVDRSNQVIDRLNAALYDTIKNHIVSWVDTDEMNDCFGNLKQEYTCDGLHLSKAGYEMFRKLIEKGIKELLECED